MVTNLLFSMKKSKQINNLPNTEKCFSSVWSIKQATRKWFNLDFSMKIGKLQHYSIVSQNQNDYHVRLSDLKKVIPNDIFNKLIDHISYIYNGSRKNIIIIKNNEIKINKYICE